MEAPLGRTCRGLGGAAAEPAHVLTITEPLCLAPPAAPPGHHPHHGDRGPRPRALGAVGCAAGFLQVGGPSRNSPRWHLRPVKPERQEQV